ncbi:hypothetical protein FPCIR_13596 [Fusarium pseudocircinatum]|uniref:Uncharacterized protein n=1 Tax=Fusarium pseudocircinatum TaxID=56676 RepID=A0A8H5KJI5_9HYPO|nr:hypothetical protein FPCIR_13596 [Fusarium pseudocircinatum]
MLSLGRTQIIYALGSLLCLLSMAIANVEKTIFTAPASLPIPQQKPSLADLRLPTLTPDAPNIRTHISRVFPSEPKDHASGVVTWVLLNKLNQGQRESKLIRLRRQQPTVFDLAVYELDAVWQTPELIQSLANYSFSRQDQEAVLATESTQGEGREREASVLLLQIKSSADYFTSDAALMKDPSRVHVDLILDPYLYGIVPRSLIPAAGYLVLVGAVAWFVSKSIASKLQTIAVTADGANKKQN